MIAKPHGLLMSVEKLRKTYSADTPQGVEVLKGIDFEIFKGDAICIMGSSGAGKSTLLHLLGALDRPTSGRVLFGDKDLFSMNDDDLSRFRNHTMGFVFQFHHLLSEFTALENVMMPALIGGQSFSTARKAAQTLLGDLGLSNRLEHRPSELSGGEQQRVAIARSLVRKPAIVFADEPTGNLDQKNSSAVQALLFELQKKHGLTLIAATHDQDFSRGFPKVRNLRDGQWV